MPLDIKTEITPLVSCSLGSIVSVAGISSHGMAGNSATRAVSANLMERF